MGGINGRWRRRYRGNSRLRAAIGLIAFAAARRRCVASVGLGRGVRHGRKRRQGWQRRRYRPLVAIGARFDVAVAITVEVRPVLSRIWPRIRPVVLAFAAKFCPVLPVV